MCTNNFTKMLPMKEFYNEDEIKYGFLPYSPEDECNVITLGIGRDVRSERELLRKFNNCKFFGIDPDAKRSGRIYKAVLNGTFVEGLVAAKSGEYEASILDKFDDLSYKKEKLKHFSFENLLAEKYEHDVIDYLFMDIEGAEFELMKELIYFPSKYPKICQINVEYHNPFLENRGMDFFEVISKSILDGPYIPLKVDTKMNFLFNRIFFVNMDKICVDKFLRNVTHIL
uniref:Methyltransferase FkbM domain-containing protein n=1 Tax=Panagrolaimus superbus TaxID=310955 RepID=A0A914Y564_9BILA